MKTKYLFLGIGIFILLAGSFFVSNSLNQPTNSNNSVKKLNCSISPDVYYLKPSELGQASKILDSNENAIVVIPETNDVHANTKILKCPGIKFEDYINFGGIR